MILIYPVLVSKSTSPNIVPGICKMLERYLLIYGMDKIFNKMGVTDVKSAAVTAYNTARPFMDQVTIEAKTQHQPSWDDDEDDDDNKKKGKEKDVGNKVDVPFKDTWTAISVEPTWINITTKKSGTQLLGIKVVPFPIETSGNVIDAISNDKAAKWFEYVAKRYSRIVIRLIGMFLRKNPFYKPAISGDPTKDILFAASEFGSEIFLSINKLDLPGSVLAKSPATMKKLYSLGWSSIVLTDDVNKEATFCMTEFKGLCSNVPYGFIYSTLGKAHQTAYDTLDDAKKSAGPFFHLTSKAAHVLGEAYRNRKIAEYIVKRRKREIISEDVKEVVVSNSSSIFGKIQDIKISIESGNLKKAKQIADSAPQKMNEIERDINQDHETKTNYEFARNVLGKTLKVGPKVVNKLAAFTAMLASETKNTKESTKEIIHSIYAALSSKTGKSMITAFLAMAWNIIATTLAKRAIFGTATGAGLKTGVQVAYKFGAAAAKAATTTALNVASPTASQTLGGIAKIATATHVGGLRAVFAPSNLYQMLKWAGHFAAQHWLILSILLVIYIVGEMISASGDEENEQQ